MTRYEILPRTQLAILPELAPTKRIGFALYGGTAIALQVGHRESIDFDFFTAEPLDEAKIFQAMPFLGNAIPLQREPDTWTVQVSPFGDTDRPVKLSFFGGLRFGRVGTPTPTSRGELLLASPLDLMGHKLKVMLNASKPKTTATSRH